MFSMSVTAISVRHLTSPKLESTAPTGHQFPAAPARQHRWGSQRTYVGLTSASFSCATGPTRYSNRESKESTQNGWTWCCRSKSFSSNCSLNKRLASCSCFNLNSRSSHLWCNQMNTLMVLAWFKVIMYSDPSVKSRWHSSSCCFNCSTVPWWEALLLWPSRLGGVCVLGLSRYSICFYLVRPLVVAILPGTEYLCSPSKEQNCLEIYLLVAAQNRVPIFSCYV